MKSLKYRKWNHDHVVWIHCHVISRNQKSYIRMQIYELVHEWFHCRENMHEFFFVISYMSSGPWKILWTSETMVPRATGPLAGGQTYMNSHTHTHSTAWLGKTAGSSHDRAAGHGWWSRWNETEQESVVLQIIKSIWNLDTQWIYLWDCDILHIHDFS